MSPFGQSGRPRRARSQRSTLDEHIHDERRHVTSKLALPVVTEGVVGEIRRVCLPLMSAPAGNVVKAPLTIAPILSSVGCVNAIGIGTTPASRGGGNAYAI